MELLRHDMSALFAQLGLPAGADDIQAFVDRHRPLPEQKTLAEAPFWNAAQARFLRETIAQDADWAPAADTLSAMLRA